jgi:ribosome-dependent ATPase
MSESAPHVSSAVSAGTPVVSIKDVSHRYGDTVALDSLSLDIPSGIMVGIIGCDGLESRRSWR